jgi:adenylosuccinate synthase
VVYEDMPGWKEDIAGAARFEELPAACQAYVLRVEALLGLPVRWIGVGPGRNHIIVRNR